MEMRVGAERGRGGGKGFREEERERVGEEV